MSSAGTAAAQRFFFWLWQLLHNFLGTGQFRIFNIVIYLWWNVCCHPMNDLIDSSYKHIIGIGWMGESKIENVAAAYDSIFPMNSPIWPELTLVKIHPKGISQTFDKLAFAHLLLIPLFFKRPLHARNLRRKQIRDHYSKVRRISKPISSWFYARDAERNSPGLGDVVTPVIGRHLASLLPEEKKIVAF